MQGLGIKGAAKGCFQGSVPVWVHLSGLVRQIGVWVLVLGTYASGASGLRLGRLGGEYAAHFGATAECLSPGLCDPFGHPYTLRNLLRGVLYFPFLEL